MLVLSRKIGEKLLIGDNIVVTVNRINGNRVAIGIEAPRDVSIVRGELEKNELPPNHDRRAGAGTPMALPLDEGSRVSIASRHCS